MSDCRLFDWCILTINTLLLPPNLLHANHFKNVLLKTKKWSTNKYWYQSLIGVFLPAVPLFASHHIEKHQLWLLIALWWCICWIPGSGPIYWSSALARYRKAYLDLAGVSCFKSLCLNGTQYGGSSVRGLARRPRWATLNIWECWESKKKRENAWPWTSDKVEM